MFLFQLASFIKILLHVMWLIWIHVIFFRDHDNMMLMQPTEVKETSIYSIGRAKELPQNQFHRLQSLQKKKSLNSHSYAIDCV